MSVIPVGNRVLVQPEPWPEQSTAGVWLPKPAYEQGRVRTATVLALGPGQLSTEGTRIPMDVKVGDTVVYLHFKGEEKHYGFGKLDRSKQIILKGEELLAVLEE